MVRAPTKTVDLAVLVPEAGLGTLVVHIPLYGADGGLCPLCPPPAGPGSGFHRLEFRKTKTNGSRTL